MKRKIEIKEVFRGVKAAFPSTVPIFFGWIFVALTYGVLMEELGYGPLWTLLFSMICFCGGMQIAACSATRFLRNSDRIIEKK